MTTTTVLSTTDTARAVYRGDHPEWCENADRVHEALFFADLSHRHNLGSIDLSLDVRDENGETPTDGTRGDVYPAAAGVMLRGGIGAAASVVLHLEGHGYDVDPDLTALEARALARLLTQAADMLDGAGA